jgi:hypothetical protein
MGFEGRNISENPKEQNHILYGTLSSFSYQYCFSHHLQPLKSVVASQNLARTKFKKAER